MKNLSKVFLLCFITLFAFAAQSMGQGKNITGQVVDALNESMPGVNVQVKGTTNGTITNIDGKFSISVPNSKSVLIFTFIGYSKQEIVVGNQAKINVQLKEDAQNLDEVVVVGYGTAKKSDLTGATASLRPDANDASKAVSIDGLLQGKIAGLNVTASMSTPGAASSVTIRGANSFPKRMYLTCNPGGVGHEWVKRLFVSRKYRNAENPNDYMFIPATVFDNAVLLETDTGYVDMLNNLPDGLREAWRDGSWDLLEGRYFDEFDRSIHIVKPFQIPEHWRKYRGMDYGLDCLACVWVAIDEHGNYYVYREYAESNKVISVGAGEIVNLTPTDERIEYTAAPPDMWGRTQESGKTKADLFREGGLPLLKSSNNREAGWLAVKDLLQVKNGSSRLMIFDNCIELIDCLTSLQRDTKHPTDCATEPHDITHLPDALRYFVLQFTSPSKPPKEEKTAVQKYREKALKGRLEKRRSYF